ncbi:MAG: cobyric acid synthase [Tissierellia bacterium]|nr:cobyric acid synthase [Tissierellia bacterium]
MKSIMIQGTTSSAGKSTIATALCRILYNKNLDIYPFKSQNMSRNFMLTDQGKMISTAQYIQAYAAGKIPEEKMNPILLIPKSDIGSEIIFMGESIKSMKAVDYFEYKKTLKPMIADIYDDIASKHDIIIIEGAGSPAEINLNHDDLVNMGMAEIADADVLLVTDIDRGGAFASLYGTVMLLPKKERDRIKGFIINKFRGDIKLLENGLDMIEDLTGIPVVGVIPYLHLEIADEDSLIEYKKSSNCLDPEILNQEIERLAKVVEENLFIDKLRGLEWSYYLL